MSVRLRRLRLRALSTALAITCLGPCVLSAQDASDRPSLEQLRLQLASAATVSQLKGIGGAWAASAPRPVTRLGKAFIRLSQAVLASRGGTKNVPRADTLLR